MMKKSLFFTIFICCLTIYNGFGQKRLIKDSSLNVFMIGFVGYGDITAGNLKDRFGSGITVGGFVSYKTISNWLFELEYAYMYSSNIREDHALDSISTKNPDPSMRYLITNTGEYQIINIYESGNIALLKVGKIIPLWSRNPNCGLVLKLGGGFMQHKLFYYWVGDPPPQLAGNYLNGYDRMTYGPAISQSAGYHYMSNNGRINFQLSLEAIEGFTYNQRAYNFDLMRKESAQRLDVLLGIKAAWFFPVYGKNSNSRGNTFY